MHSPFLHQARLTSRVKFWSWKEKKKQINHWSSTSSNNVVSAITQLTQVLLLLLAVV